MRKITLLAGSTAAFSAALAAISIVAAEPPRDVTAQGTRDLVSQKTRDVAANCTACHGTRGQSRGGIPALAGRDRAAIVQMMHEFQSGAHAGTVMPQLAKGYSAEEIDAAATYFAAQPRL